ncbi:hypothetical protein EW093_03850 [Thiospirochaeta perfilievii]|uniref:Transmembrane protein (PGPGW) n=1 Tax=Thiospirochaeta perfilievii TaxID=252967 RepID=A0A5C1QAC4_9SPIO|nr:PGPGW domain-containing protein [Thiospirochaeta perfilievii]QEN03869.1 hypothetical protein EW093_03850 [Thiospirochaeta perfilievii]
MFDFLILHRELILIFTIFSAITFLVSLIIIPFVIINLSPDYFKGANKPLYRYKNLFIRYFVLILKNIVGYIFIILGVIMLFIPGQGLLSITLGLLFINFPGKKSLEYKFFSNKKISKVINSIRKKAGREEILF